MAGGNGGRDGFLQVATVGGVGLAGGVWAVLNKFVSEGAFWQGGPMKLILLLVTGLSALSLAATPEVAELSFDSRYADLATAEGVVLPSWITGIGQEGGTYVDEPRCWKVEAASKHGEGRLEIAVDRSLIPSGNLVATLLFDADENADVAVQLFDSQGRAVVVDLFGNLVDIGMQATTDTFVIPLSKYPSADRIVIRRVQGGLRLHGLVLFPVVTEGPMEEEALRELARVLGDPLSAANPLVTSLQKVARESEVKVAAVKPVLKKAADLPPFYAAAQPFQGDQVPAAPTDGLWVYLGFDQLDASNSAPRGGVAMVNGTATFEQADRGNVLRLKKRPDKAPGIPWDSLTLPREMMPPVKDQISLCAWVRHRHLDKGWGAQILWHGDRRTGRDPWVLNMTPLGHVQFRSDRSVTGRPQFVVFQNEIHVTPAGKAQLTQHVAIKSPQRLEKDHWYFVVATMDMLSARARIMRLYVNGELVNELQTPEVVEYDTDKMWTTIGAVHRGEGQSFNGDIDDVRIYDRALSAEEVVALYQQPWE